MSELQRKKSSLSCSFLFLHFFIFLIYYRNLWLYCCSFGSSGFSVTWNFFLFCQKCNLLLFRILSFLSPPFNFILFSFGRTMRGKIRLYIFSVRSAGYHVQVQIISISPSDMMVILLI